MKHKATKLLALLLSVAFAGHAQQLSEYTFTHDEAEFQTIVGTPGAHTDVWGYNEQDDGSRTLAMPFAFPFGESTIAAGSNVILSANGYLQFGNISMGSYPNVAYTTSGHQYKAIVPYINSDGYCLGNIYWADTTDEATDEQVLIAEFRGITTYSAKANPECMNYQIRLYPDGRIEVVYDHSDFNAVANHTLIMANGYADRLCLTGSWDSPVVDQPSSLPTLAGVPDSGTRYTFSIPEDYCSKPQNLAITAVTAESLTLEWESEAESFTIYWADNDTAWTDSTDVDEPSFTLDGLEPATLYHFALRADCSDESHSSYAMLDARTECAIITADRLPYIEDFEADYSNAEFVPCWTRWYKSYNGTLSSGYDTYTSNIIFSYTGVDNHYMRLSVTPQVNSGVDRQWCLVALPEFDEEVQNLQLSFRHSMNQAEGAVVEVGLMTNRDDTATFEPFDTIAVSSNWDTATVDFAAYEGEGRFIALRFYTTTTSGYSTYYCSIDDVAVLATPSCDMPQAIAATEVFTTSATLSIDDPTPGEYLVVYLSDTDSLSTTVSATTFELTDLAPATRYTVYASKLCPDGSQTLRVGTTFTTACYTVQHADLPLVEDFNSLTAYNGASLAPCWTVLNLHPTSGGYPSSWQNHSGLNGNCLYLYADSAVRGQYVSLPEVDEVTDLELTFWTYASQDYQRIDVGVMSDPTDTATFTLIATITPEQTGVWDAQWEEHYVTFASYTGEGRYIALRNRNTTSFTGFAIAVDDIRLDIATGCHHPVAIALDSASESSLTLTIADPDQVNNYRIWYAPATSEAEPDSIDVEEATFTLQGLESGTLYNVSCAAICPGGNLTTSVSATGWTLCAMRTADDLPYSEGFEQWEATIHSDLGACWQAFYGTADSAMSTYAKVYTSSDLDNQGHHAVRLAAQHSYSTGEQYSTLVLPQFDVNPRLLQLDFRFRFAYQYVHEGEYVEVGIMSNPSDPSTFVPCYRYYNPGNYQYADHTARFGRFGGEAGAVAIRYHYNVPNDNAYMMLDSVSLTLLDEEDVACDVEGLTITDITDSSALARWAYGCEVDSFFVELALDDVVTALVAHDTLLALANLLPDTTYTLRVRGPHDGDLWTAAIPFRTLSGTVYHTVSVATEHLGGRYQSQFDDYVSGAGTYAHGETVTLQGDEIGCYISFVCWITAEGDTIYNNPYTFVITDDVALTAVFEYVGGIGDTPLASVGLRPNPATTSVSVDLEGQARVEVLDQRGRQVLATEANGSATLDVSHLATGTYFVRVSTAAATAVRKLIVK